MFAPLLAGGGPTPSLLVGGGPNPPLVPLSAGGGPLPAGGLDAVVFLLVGFLGGAHCLGMCGPLVSVYADRLRAQEGADDALTFRQVRQHLLFNLGRTAGYAAVGALVGLVGAVAVGTLDQLLAVGDGVRGTTGLLAGSLILATGVSYVRGSAAPSLPVVGDHSLPVVGGLFGRVSGFLTGRVDAFVGDARIAGLGAVHALLPCPIIYPAYVYAFALADPVRGGFLLALVGVGTMPTLLVYGTLLGSLSGGQWLHRALGAAFVVLGYATLAHGLHLLGVGVPHLPLPIPTPTYPPLG